MYWHIYSYYSATDPIERARNDEAKRSWEEHWPDVRDAPFIEDSPVARIPDEPLAVPFVGELLNGVANDNDVILLTNMDTIVGNQTLGVIERTLNRSLPATCSSRWDIDANGKEHRHPGHDLFAFRKSWWPQESPVNEMLIAYEGWDWLLFQEIKNELRDPIVWHRQHQQFWYQNRLQKKGNEWNLRKIWESRFRQQAMKERQFRQAFRYYEWL